MMKAKYRTKSGKHDPKKSMLNFLTGAGPTMTDLAAKGAANWHTLTAPEDEGGMGYNVTYDAAIQDVFSAQQDLEQFSQEIGDPKFFGVTLTIQEITDAKTFGKLVQIITLKQLGLST